MKLLSVIIPVYNVEQYLRKSLDSVINQTYKDLEIICVNDGSTDNSGAILDEYAKKDSRIKVFHKQNGGVASARNLALKNATGEYITFLDPDDWIDSNMYSEMISKIAKDNAEICSCAFYKNWDNKEVLQENSEIISSGIFGPEEMFYYAFKRYAYKSVGAYLWNKIFDAELLRDIVFDDELAVGEDVLYFVLATIKARRCVYCNTPYYHYFQRKDSLCHNNDIKKRAGSLITFQRIIDLFSANNYSEELLDLAKRFYTYHASLLAERAYMVHDYESMRTMQTNIGKYIDSYIRTSENHEEWNTKMILMQTDVEKAITYARNRQDEERRNAYATALNEPIEKNVILYESFFGRGMLCGPYAIFKEFSQRDDFDEYIHIWSISTEDEIEKLKKEYAQYENVKFVLRSGNEYAYYLATSKYLINNDNFFYFFVKREGQVYINTWHGIPMKKLGYDVEDGIIEQHNSFRNFRMTDCLLAWNVHMADIFKSAYKLDTNYQGEIVISGCPRNDITLKTDRTEILDKLKRAGIKIDPAKKMILYAPTFRGTNLQSAEIDMSEVIEMIDFVENNVSEEFYILFKPHHLVYKKMIESGVNDTRIIPANFDANEILAVTDILISDYSSIYLDFLVTKRPIIFYTPDEDDYKKYRGLYFDTSVLPGTVCCNYDELVNAISSSETYMTVFGDIHKRFSEWACNLDDGNVSNKVIEKYIIGSDENIVHSKRCIVKKSQREVLLLCGSLYDEDVFEETLSYIKDNADINTNITVLFDLPKTEILREKIMKSLNGVRGLGRVAAMPITYSESELLNVDSFHNKSDKRLRDVVLREIRRCLFDMRFDQVVLVGHDDVYSAMKDYLVV